MPNKTVRSPPTLRPSQKKTPAVAAEPSVPSPTSPTTPTPPAVPALSDPSALDRIMSALGSITNQLAALTTKVDDIQETIASITDRITKLESVNEDLNSAVMNLKRSDNDREQYMRNNSIRISGMKIPSGSEKNNLKVMKLVYDGILKPTLDYAVIAGDIDEVPVLLNLVSNAHILPVKNQAQTPQIILRFSSVFMRDIFFKYKAVFMKTRPMDEKIFVNEDLTHLNYKCMRTLIKDETVKSCWSRKGRIWFMTVKDETAIPVKNIFKFISPS